MCKGILGKKIGMMGTYNHKREYVPVTVVKVGPCIVTQVKTKPKDGYNSLQLGFDEKKISKANRPMQGHLKKAGDNAYSFIKEVAVENPDNYSIGQKIMPEEIFSIGERVAVSGKSKGRGFSGVMKRHKFSGGRKTHGSHSVRIPGSIGTSAWPSRVVKGKKLPGQYGNERRTVRNLLIMDIRSDDHLLMLKGAVPGHNGAYLEIKKR